MQYDTLTNDQKKIVEKLTLLPANLTKSLWDYEGGDEYGAEIAKALRIQSMVFFEFQEPLLSEAIKQYTGEVTEEGGVIFLRKGDNAATITVDENGQSAKMQTMIPKQGVTIKVKITPSSVNAAAYNH